MMRRWIWMLVLAGCNGPEVITDEDTDVPIQPTRGDGDPCEPGQCRDGLTCNSQYECAPLNTIGTGAEDETCGATVDCRAGLVCSSAETCAQPTVAGTAGVGDTCADHDDCQAGFFCYQDACAGLDTPLWAGATCGDDAEAEPQILFDRPRDRNDQDYYRHPFPSDARVGTAGTDFTDHPTFEHPVFGDVAAGWLASASRLRGFGPNQNLFFRTTFPAGSDFAAPGDLTGAASLGVVALDDGTPQPVGWQFRSRLRYICDPYVTVGTATGAPYAPDRTYGGAITIDATLDGESPQPSDTLSDVLATATPADSALLDTWQAFGPFRDGFEAVAFDRLASATTFTTRDIEAVGVGIRQASTGALAPTLDVLHVCAGSPGPLADASAPERGCHDVPNGFTEIQARITVPMIQPGAAPFPLPALGGEATWVDGVPDIVGYGNLELTLTVPDAAPPIGGYPVVLFAPGADGDYRTSVSSGLAGQWSSVSNASGTANFAVLSIDTWLTGPRAGSIDPSWADAHDAVGEIATLYTSPLNPAAARDNIAQSALDWLTAVRWLEAIDWSDAGSSPTGTSVAFDLASLHFVGQDIGGLAGPAFAAHEPRVKSVVLAATPASWIDVVSQADAPYPAADIVGAVLGDPRISQLHPMLNVGQGIVDDTEPVVHARWLVGNGTPRDVLLVNGVNDRYVGALSQEALGVSLRAAALEGPGAQAPNSLQSVSAPVHGNRNGRTVVALFNQGDDPHRLLLQDAPTQTQVRTFLSTRVLDGVATVP